MPRGWAVAPVTDIITVHDNERIPLNKMQRAAMRGSIPYYGANGLVDHVSDYIFEGDYVLLAEDGGYFDEPARGVAYEVSGRFWVNNHAHVLKPRGGIQGRFLRHLLNATDWMPYVSGTTRLKLSQAGMHRASVGVPPLAEQSRIVAKVDSLFAKSNRAREELSHIPHLIERYKQTILAAVFRGELTADWRAANQSSIQHTKESWKTLEIGRELRWVEEEERRDRIKGRSRSRTTIRARYAKPSAEEPEVSPETGWLRAKLGQFCLVLGGKRLPKGASYAEGQTSFPYLRVIDFPDGRFVPDNVKHLDAETQAAIAYYIIEARDVLISIAGTVGVTCVIPGAFNGANLTENAARILPSNAVLPRFLDLFLKSPLGQQQIIGATVATGQPKLALFRIEQIKVPVPHAEEQRRIIELVERAFSWVDMIAQEHIGASRLVGHLDQSILAKAFRGKLVPQDPNDEPASVLLERIRAERITQAVRRSRKRAVTG